MKDKSDSFLSIAKFGKCHGVSGYIYIRPFSCSLVQFLSYEQWFIKSSGYNESFVNIEIEKHRVINNKYLIVKISDINDREGVAEFINQEIYIKYSQLPKIKDQYYWVDLIGLKMVDTKNNLIGVVDNMIETGSNDVFVVKNNKEILIPYIDSVVKSIDLKNSIIIIDDKYDYEY